MRADAAAGHDAAKANGHGVTLSGGYYPSGGITLTLYRGSNKEDWLAGTMSSSESMGMRIKNRCQDPWVLTAV